jgi:serine phosphatase RsbU (regulator of sigma subunit)
MVTDITKQKKIEQEIRALHKHTRESIEYASLIQHSLIPSNDLFRKYFSDYLTIWHPKDIVGGDIYLFDELRDENECLLMVIDCTGHGVPGAFVTMLVKAIERQISTMITNNAIKEVSPSWILEYFNKTMKKLLRQEDDEAISNAGFDGGILYYNKKEKLIKYAGAETSLVYVDASGEVNTIKGNRHSIGYKKSDANFEFKEHIIEAQEGMKFYLTTDGYLDQNGGEKGFPFGKKRFGNIIKEYHNYSFADQQEVLLNSMFEYQGDEERNDDVTVIGIKI